MIGLMAIAVLLLAATVWFLARPLARAAIAPGVEEYHQLVQLRGRLIAQLNELDIEAGDRNMDAATVGDERQRLEAELAGVLHRLAGRSPPETPVGAGVSRRPWIATLATLGVLLPLAAAGLYAAKHYPMLKVLYTLEAAGPPDPRKMVARLEQRLAEQPGDAAGWARLGRAYTVLERFEEAKAAYGRAATLAPDDGAILTEYASFLIAENPRDPSPEAVALFTRLHRLDPKHPGALWVLGLHAYNSGRFAQAVLHWEGLLGQLPPESEVQPQVQSAIAQARARLKK